MRELVKEFNKENLKPIIFIIIVVILTAITAYPQRKFGGTVVEIVNGKTAVIQVSSGNKVTVVLQFIEIPEAEQPLHQTVKEHLETLLLGKTVEFLPRRILKSESVGQIVANGVDISQQMLRDGAAWYALPEKSAQDTSESELYQTLEAQAKTEKRGVWGVENLKTAWEFRAEREELRNQEERAKLQAIMPQTVSQNNSSTTVKPKKKPMLSVDMWSNVGDTTTAKASVDGTGLITGTVPKYGFGYVSTSGSFLDLPGDRLKPKIESRALYVYSQQKEKTAANSGYLLGFLAESEAYSFVEANSLTIIADKQKFNLGKAYRFFRQMPYTVQELLIYKIDAKTLSKIAAAKDVEIKLGKYSSKMGDDYQTRLKNLLTVTD